MRQLPKYWFPCLLALMLPAACAPARTVTKAQERSLLEQATTRTDTNGWDIYYHHAFGYHWLSPHEVIFFRWFSKNDGLFRRDTLTGHEYRMKRLEALLSALDATDFRPDISPNKGWLLTYSRKLQRTELVALDGSCHRPAPQGLCYFWLADSRHFAVLCFGGGKVRNSAYYWLVGSIKKPRTAVKIPVRASLSLDVRADKVYNGKWFILTEGYDSSEDEPPPAHDDVRISTSGLGVSAAQEADYVVRVPTETTIVSVVASAHNGRVAYVLKRRLPNTADKLEQRAASSSSNFHAGLYEIWTSRIDGHQLHKIGSVEGKKAPRGDNRDAPKLCWLPGGSEISLLYRDALYTIPVH